MGRKTYDAQVVVLRKTKLGESDLILTMMAEDGQQLRAVAKGARKPTSSFASRLELFSEAQVLLAEGRSLDIVKEARLIDGHARLRSDYERGASAAPIAELLAHATQPELPVERLYPMTQAALSTLERAPESSLVLLACAFLLKCSALLGFRPSLSACTECGQPRQAPSEGSYLVSFSPEAGGVLCPDCAAFSEVPRIDCAIVDWAQTLLGSTFSEISAMSANPDTQMAIARFTRSWVEVHLSPVKSLGSLVGLQPSFDV